MTAAARALAALAVVALAALAPRAGAEPALRLAGLLPLEAATERGWCWSGAWEFPVADRFELGAAGADGAPPFQVNRNVGPPGGYAHQGADLANGRGGDEVRAAAHGVVVAAAHGWNGGYGNCVVLAHRLPEGDLAYSVYAHLLAGSVRVKPGDIVLAGARLGRVGRTGRATTLHLHFEVRLAGPWDERWEKARVVDPVAFVRARLPAARAGATREDRLLEWAEYAALLPRGSDPAAALARADWWRMLAHAARHTHDAIPGRPDSLRAWLVTEGMIDGASSRDPSSAPAWNEVAADLARLCHAGLRLPPAPHEEREFESWCHARFAEARPALHPQRLERMPDHGPTALDACLLLAAAATGDAGRR